MFALRNKSEPRKINLVEILEESIAKINNIANGQNAGSVDTGEKDIPGNCMTGNTHGSA